MTGREHKCPVCGKTEFPKDHSLEVCDICGWTDDWYQAEHPDEDCLANIMSLNQAKEAYKKGEKIE